MNDAIFRKKSLDKVKSPENLDDYIRVSNPGVWLLLISVIVLLIGACIWGAFGHVDSTVSSGVSIENGVAVCYIADKDISSVQSGMTVEFSDYKAEIVRIGEKSEIGYICELSADSPLPDGFYEGKVITESFKPLSFILN